MEKIFLVGTKEMKISTHIIYIFLELLKTSLLEEETGPLEIFLFLFVVSFTW